MKILLIIFIIIIALASSGTLSTPWEIKCKVVLHNNQSAICSDYSITSVQFSSPIKAHNIINGTQVLDYPANRAVSFKVSHNNLTEFMLMSPESPTLTTEYDAVQFNISDFTPADSLLWEISQYNPSATLTISKRQIPNASISVSVKPETTEYRTGDGKIRWIVELKNNGEIDLSDLLLSYPKHDNISIAVLNMNDTASKYDFYEDIPIVEYNTTHEFKVNVHLNMVISPEMKIIRSFNGSGTVFINPKRETIFLNKAIKPRIYTENNTVTVSLTNLGTYTLSYIVVTDRFKSSGILHTWAVDRLSPGQSTRFSYIVKPSQAGKFTSPASSATFMINGKFREILSNTVEVTVVSTGQSIPISQDEVYTEPAQKPILISQDKVNIEPTQTPIPIFPDEAYIEQTEIPPAVPIEPLPSTTPLRSIPGFSWVAGIILLWAASLKR